MDNGLAGTQLIETTAADVMLDHPSWLVNDDGLVCRAVRCESSVWTVTCSPLLATGRTVRMHRESGHVGSPTLDVIDPDCLPADDDVAVALRNAGVVARLRNPDLWDALVTSIVRQVIRAGQARKLYRTFCREHGEHVPTPAGTAHLVPTPETVLELPDQEFARLGMAFKQRPLRAAAEAYLEFGAKWRMLEPGQLLVEVQQVPRIGPWTAGATVADVTNDYSLYPFADLAVRTWVKRLTSGRQWPEIEPEFARIWQELAGEYLSEWTLLTLAWGVSHAATTGATAI